MKSSRWFAAVVLLASSAASAQQPAGPHKAEMKKLDFLAGKWKGPASVTQGPKDALSLTQTEDVEYRLDGVVMVVEGTGRGKQPGKDVEGVLFNALAVISYDAAAKKYKIKAYRVEGTSVEADLVLSDKEKGFTWGFKEPTRGVEVKYTMKITPKDEWHEVGEYTLDGKTWTKFIEMTLTRAK